MKWNGDNTNKITNIQILFVGSMCVICVCVQSWVCVRVCMRARVCVCEFAYQQPGKYNLMTYVWITRVSSTEPRKRSLNPRPLGFRICKSVQLITTKPHSSAVHTCKILPSNYEFISFLKSIWKELKTYKRVLHPSIEPLPPWSSTVFTVTVSAKYVWHTIFYKLLKYPHI